MDRRGRLATVLVLVAVTLLVVALHQQYFADVKPQTKSSGGVRAKKIIEKLWSTPFTTSEMNYVLTGEGDSLVLPNDPRYLDFLRSQIAHPVQSLNRSVPKRWGSSDKDDLALIVDRRLRGKKNGFFVDCGANDGLWLSSTVFLETERQWKGLLIEANRKETKKLWNLNRRAYVFGGCLSPVNYSTTLVFKSARGQGGLRDLLGELDSHIKIVGSFESFDYVYCVPLVDLLNAIEVKHVDFLSLDVQGAELAILKTIDLRAVRIDVIIVEAHSPDSVLSLTKFFNDTGIYRVIGKVSDIDLMAERLDLP